MEATEALQALLRWIHIVAGIIWIGLLYFFNFVNAGFAATMDGPTKQKVVPELMPRALYWFRWGAAWTWVTGVLLLLLVFWHGGIMFGPRGGSTTLAVLMVLVTFLAAALYDVLAKSGWSKDIRLVGGVGWALAVLVILAYLGAGFGYRAYVIHTGAMFGTIMAFNVWMRIWPAQRQIITATKQGQGDLRGSRGRGPRRRGRPTPRLCAADAERAEGFGDQGAVAGGDFALDDGNGRAEAHHAGAAEEELLAREGDVGDVEAVRG